MENGAPRGRAVRTAYLEPQYNPLKSSAGAFLGGGGAVGATAAIPGIGTLTSFGLSSVAVTGYLEATAL